MNIYFTLLVLSCAFYVTRTQVLQCHNCYYSSIPNGFLPKKVREITDISCDKDKSPSNSSLVTCVSSSDPNLVTLCAKIFVKGVIPAWSEEYETIRATCLQLPPSVKYGCRLSEKGDLMSSPFIPDEIKGDLNFYSDSSTVQICTCQENGCNSSVPLSKINVLAFFATLFAINFKYLFLNG